MIVYNVTTKVEASIATAWLQWMQQEHIPEVLATGCFTEANIHRLLEIDDSEGPTYSVQYKAESKALYNQYINQFAVAMRQKTFDAWGNRFIAFRSLMQLVN